MSSTCRTYIAVLVRVHLLHDELLLMPVEAASYQLDFERLGRDEVGVAVGGGVGVEHGLVQVQLPLHVRQVTYLQQTLTQRAVNVKCVCNNPITLTGITHRNAFIYTCRRFNV